MKEQASKKKHGGDNGKRTPITDEEGLIWCACTAPNLIRPSYRGYAHCIKCNKPWYN